MSRGKSILNRKCPNYETFDEDKFTKTSFQLYSSTYLINFMVYIVIGCKWYMLISNLDFYYHFNYLPRLFDIYSLIQPIHKSFRGIVLRSRNSVGNKIEVLLSGNLCSDGSDRQ